MNDKSLLKVIDVLYDTALDRGSWPQLLEALAEPVGAVTGHLLNWDKNTGLVSHYEVFGVDEDAMDSYASHWVLEDPRAAHHLKNPDVRFFSDEMCVSLREKNQQAFFNEWEHQFTEERYVVGHRVYLGEEREIILSLGFGDPHGGIRDQAISLFKRLSTHLQRAVEIHHLFGQHLHDQSPEMLVLNNLNFGVIFLDELGRPSFYNRIAERISERGDGLRLRSNGLCAMDSQSHNRLESMIRSCRRGEETLEAPAGGWISVARGDPGPDYSLLVIPMPETREFRLFSSPRVLIMISDPAEGREDVGDALRHLYKLTESEARVCLSLVAGNDTNGIADELCVSREAIRFHLKNIFSKTGVKRQGELIRLVLTLPPSPGTTLPP